MDLRNDIKIQRDGTLVVADALDSDCGCADILVVRICHNVICIRLQYTAFRGGHFDRRAVFIP